MLLNPHGSVVDEVSAVLAIAQHTTVAQPAVDGPRVSSLDLLSEVVTVENSSSEEISLDGWTVQSTTGARSQRLPPGNTPNAPLRASCVVILGSHDPLHVTYACVVRCVFHAGRQVDRAMRFQTGALLLRALQSRFDRDRRSSRRWRMIMRRRLKAR